MLDAQIARELLSAGANRDRRFSVCRRFFYLFKPQHQEFCKPLAQLINLLPRKDDDQPK